MRVMIVGCGKVGRTLAEQLQEENIDLTLVDTREHKLNELSDDIDALGIVGNGASINTLMEAGIESTDILIAVTNSDELNLLCCLIAQKASKCHTRSTAMRSASSVNGSDFPPSSIRNMPPPWRSPAFSGSLPP